MVDIYFDLFTISYNFTSQFLTELKKNFNIVKACSIEGKLKKKIQKTTNFYIIY